MTVAYPGRRLVRRIVFACGLALTAAAWVSRVPAFGQPLPSSLQQSAAPSAQPNIVLILTDDQTIDELGSMPAVKSELMAKGVNFPNGFVVNSLCCPSRATILTGEYSHGTDVYRNNPPHGGFQTFVSEDRSTMATWLQATGYRTALVGKYLNGYGTNPTYVPPGWDSWNAALISDSDKGGYYDYRMDIGGSIRRYGDRPSDYSTDVFAGYATRFIRSVPQGQPLFLYFAPHAPHEPATPPPRYETSLSGVPPYRPANFNEANVSDKPPWAQIAALDERQIQRLDAFRKDQLRSLLAVDDAVARILGALRDTGRLSDTLIVFTSDNGLENGSHRWLGKALPWDESIRVPFIVRFDPLTRGVGTSDPRIVLNLDVAPTFAAAAGIAAPGAEGMSFLPLLAGGPVPWRRDFLVEHLAPTLDHVPTYCAVRSARYMYAEYEGASMPGRVFELALRRGPPSWLLFATALAWILLAVIAIVRRPEGPTQVSGNPVGPGATGGVTMAARIVSFLVGAVLIVGGGIVIAGRQGLVSDRTFIRTSQELYDLRTDPHEQSNLANRAAYARIEASLHSRMVRLCSPPPPGFEP